MWLEIRGRETKEKRTKQKIVVSQIHIKEGKFH